MGKVAFITDLHLLEKNVEKKGVNTIQNWKTVLKDVKKRDLKRIILGGDLGEKESLSKLFLDIEEFDYQYVLGNHDHIKNFEKFDSKTEDKEHLFYHSKIKNFDCIFLDTSSHKLNNKQQEFLKNWLQNAINATIFIHHPVLEIGTWMDENYPLKNRKEVEEIINEVGKKVTLICGHYHRHHEKYTNFIRQIIAPAISYQIPYGQNYEKDISNFGYLILDFSENELHFEKIMFNKQ